MKYYNIPPLIVGTFRSIKHKIRTSKKRKADAEVGDQSSDISSCVYKIYLCVYGATSELKAAFSFSFWFHSRLDCVIRIISDTNDFHSDSVSFMDPMGPLVPGTDVQAF